MESHHDTEVSTSRKEFTVDDDKQFIISACC